MERLRRARDNYYEYNPVRWRNIPAALRYAAGYREPSPEPRTYMNMGQTINTRNAEYNREFMAQYRAAQQRAYEENLRQRQNEWLRTEPERRAAEAYSRRNLAEENRLRRAEENRLRRAEENRLRRADPSEYYSSEFNSAYPTFSSYNKMARLSKNWLDVDVKSAFKSLEQAKRNGDERAIRHAYHTIVVRIHPDKHRASTESQAKAAILFKRLTELMKRS